MNQLPDYLLKLSLGLTLIWLFYYLVLRRLTFYNWNRWYLLLYSALSFVIPFVNLNQTLPPQRLAEIPILRSVPAIPSTTVETQYIASDGNEKQQISATIVPHETSKIPFTPEKILTGLLTLGVVFMLLRLMLHLVAYFRIKSQAQLVLDEDNVQVYHVARPIVPFSFGNAIFFNPELHGASDIQEIMRHERVHVRQRHTFDVIFAELLCALNWYNPFAWLIRHAIRQNLEFIADREVLENGTEARTYQFLLLKVAGVPEFRLANQFNFSSLKQRIIMMNRLKSARVHLLRFLFVVPLLLVLLVFFRTDAESLSVKAQQLSPPASGEVEYEYLAGILMDAETGKPIANLPLEKVVSEFRREKTISKAVPIDTLETITTDENGFYFWKIDVRSQPNQTFVYQLEAKDLKFKNLNMSVIHYKNWSTSANHHLTVQFLTDGQQKGLQNTFSILREEFPKTDKEDSERTLTKQLLLEKLPKFITDHRMIFDFKKQYWKPTKTITRFRNGYFDKDRLLLGFVGELQFFLDGKEVNYEQINQEFEGYLIKPASREGERYQFGINSRLYYLTFPLFKKPPPQELLTIENLEWISKDHFDIARLNNEPYILDGFRQVYGTGSNLMPLKEEIKRVAIFKGDLARYYDRKLDKIWWVETRPVEEVMERPDFVAR